MSFLRGVGTGEKGEMGKRLKFTDYDVVLRMRKNKLRADMPDLATVELNVIGRIAYYTN